MPSSLSSSTVTSVYSTSQCHFLCLHHTTFECTSIDFNDYSNYCYLQQGNMTTVGATETYNQYRMHWDYHNVGKYERLHSGCHIDAQSV